MLTSTDFLRTITDPLKFAAHFWPDVRFYKKQVDIIEAYRDSDEVVVHACNMSGKDFVAGFLALSGFMFPQMYFPPEYVSWIESQRSPTNPNPHTVRIITTSVKDDHLRVLWGEIGRYVQTCRYPMDYRKCIEGGYIVNHRDIRKMVGKGESRQEDKISYLRGMVTEKGEGLAGHHAAYTFGIVDEASSMDDLTYTQMKTWAKKFLMIGNPLPCENEFRRAVKGGDILEPPEMRAV